MSGSPAGVGSGKARSEDELGTKWDRCIADLIVKTGSCMHSLCGVVCVECVECGVVCVECVECGVVCMCH